MGDSHTYVNPDNPYYDSHCLNKDIPALINQVDCANLMKSVHNINLAKKIEYNKKINNIKLKSNYIDQFKSFIYK